MRICYLPKDKIGDRIIISDPRQIHHLAVVLRLKRRPTPELLTILNERYRDLLASGEFELLDGPHRAAPDGDIFILDRIAQNHVAVGGMQSQRLAHRLAHLLGAFEQGVTQRLN